MFAKRLTPKSSVNLTSTDDQNTASINFTIRKNLTKYRKMLFRSQKFKLSMKYQFLWNWQGQIIIRKTESRKIWKISFLCDLANIAYKNSQEGNSFSLPNLKMTIWYTFVTLISGYFM